MIGSQTRKGTTELLKTKLLSGSLAAHKLLPESSVVAGDIGRRIRPATHIHEMALGLAGKPTRPLGAVGWARRSCYDILPRLVLEAGDVEPASSASRELRETSGRLTPWQKPFLAGTSKRVRRHLIGVLTGVCRTPGSEVFWKVAC
jgi:hypothetical protein